jgi:prepilin-type N-terminal cleavage/methylation domain-containing protein
MSKIRTNRLGSNGFTLIELMATIVVISFVVLSIASLYYSSQTAERRSNYLDQATRAAQREVEILRSNRYSSLTVGQAVTFTDDLPTSLPKNRTGTVAVTEPLAGLKRVDVTVSYTDAGKSQQVVLTSLIGEIGLSK